MQGGNIGHHHCTVDHCGLRHEGNGNVLHLSPQIVQDGNGVEDGGLHLGLDHIGVGLGLDEVEQVEFYALDASGNEHTYWPQPGADPNDPERKLVGLILRIEVSPYGVIERVWEVPSV